MEGKNRNKLKVWWVSNKPYMEDLRQPFGKQIFLYESFTSMLDFVEEKCYRAADKIDSLRGGHVRKKLCEFIDKQEAAVQTPLEDEEVNLYNIDTKSDWNWPLRDKE
jgi:hypothetical protein